MKYLHYYENIEGLSNNSVSLPPYFYLDKLIQYDFYYSYKDNTLEPKTGYSKTYLNILKDRALFQSDSIEECKMFFKVKKYNL